MSADPDVPVATTAQVRAVRAWLRMTQDEFALWASVPKRTLARIELDEAAPHEGTMRKLQAALEGHGVEFLFEGATAAGIVVRLPGPARRPKRDRAGARAGKAGETT